MRPIRAAMQALGRMITWVDVKQESDETNREVQCEGERDETTNGREMFRAAFHLNPGGFKHRARAGGKALIVRLFDGLILGIEDDENAPTDLAAGETALFNASDSTGKSCVRCVSTRVEIGSAAGGLLMRKDRFETWYNANPRANHLLHVHPGVMGGPASTGVTVTDLGAVGTVECDEDHRVK